MVRSTKYSKYSCESVKKLKYAMCRIFSKISIESKDFVRILLNLEREMNDRGEDRRKVKSTYLNICHNLELRGRES